MTTTHNRQTIDIENSGNSVVVNVEGRTIVEVAIRGDGAASYRVDGREDDSENWVTGVMGNPEYQGASDYDDTIETGWESIRIQCTSGTGTPDDTAEIVLCAGGK